MFEFGIAVRDFRLPVGVVLSNTVGLAAHLKDGKNQAS